LRARSLQMLVLMCLSPRWRRCEYSLYLRRALISNKILQREVLDFAQNAFLDVTMHVILESEFQEILYYYVADSHHFT
jgi:hypothetical protein